MVGEVGSLTKREELWAKRGDALLHGALHGAVGAWCEITCIIASGTIFEKLLKCVDFTNKFHKVVDALILEVCSLDLLTEDVQLQVTQMSDGHLVLSRLELIVVLELGRVGRSVIVGHRRHDHIAGAGREGAIENVKIKEVFDCASLVVQSQSLLHLSKIGEWESQRLALTSAFKLLDQITRRLSDHNIVLTFVGRNG